MHSGVGVPAARLLPPTVLYDAETSAGTHSALDAELAAANSPEFREQRLRLQLHRAGTRQTCSRY